MTTMETTGRAVPHAVESELDVPPLCGRRVAVLAVHHVEVGDRVFTGGAEKYLQTVIKGLLEAGVSVHVGYSGTTIYRDLLESFHPRQLTVECTDWLDPALSGDARFDIATIRHRRRWLRACGADTVFAVQQAGGGAFGCSLVAARSLGLRVVASLRQLPQALPAPGAKRWLGFLPSPELWRRRLLWRRRFPALCCDALIYNSQRVANAYHDAYRFPPKRAHVIYNGEVPKLRSSIDNGHEIASVGRVTEAKGSDILLDAFTIVARRYPDSKLTFYGDGPLIPTLEARARVRGLSDRVSFPGYVRSRDRIFKGIDICVQPSRRESMSNSVVEAMAQGIPCVVADAGGMPEVITDGESGFVIPIGQPAACADAICKLFEDKHRYRQFSAAALARSRRHFDIRGLLPETLRVILGN